MAAGAQAAPPQQPPARRVRAWGNPSSVSGLPRDLTPFAGGPLRRASEDLDAAYYGAAHANRQARTAWSVRVLFASLRRLGLFGYGPATPSPEEDEELLGRPGPRLQDTTYWIRDLHQIEEPLSLPAHGWEGVLAWRLDVLLALSELPRSRWRVFCFYADGYERSELAELVGSEPWGAPSVRAVLKEASSHVRRRCELDAPGRYERRRPRPEATPTSRIREVEAEWAALREARNTKHVSRSLAAAA